MKGSGPGSRASLAVRLHVTCMCTCPQRLQHPGGAGRIPGMTLNTPFYTRFTPLRFPVPPIIPRTAHAKTPVCGAVIMIMKPSISTSSILSIKYHEYRHTLTPMSLSCHERAKYVEKTLSLREPTLDVRI